MAMPKTIRCPEQGSPGAFLGQDESLAFRVSAAPARGFRYTTYSMLYCREILPSLSLSGAPVAQALFKSIEAYHNKSLITMGNMDLRFKELQDQESMLGLNQVIRGSVFNKFLLCSMLSRIVAEKEVTEIPEDDWMAARLAAAVMEFYAQRLYMQMAGRIRVSMHSIRVFSDDVVGSLLANARVVTGAQGVYEALRLLPDMDPRIEVLQMAVPNATVWEDVEIPEGGWYNTDFNPGIEF